MKKLFALVLAVLVCTALLLPVGAVDNGQDTTPPLLTVVPGSDSILEEGERISITTTDAGKLKMVRYKWTSDPSYQEYSVEGEFSVTIETNPVGAPGTYTLMVESIDITGNVSTATSTYHVESETAPQTFDPTVIFLYVALLSLVGASLFCEIRKSKNQN